MKRQYIWTTLVLASLFAMLLVFPRFDPAHFVYQRTGLHAHKAKTVTRGGQILGSRFTLVQVMGQPYYLQQHTNMQLFCRGYPRCDKNWSRPQGRIALPQDMPAEGACVVAFFGESALYYDGARRIMCVNGDGLWISENGS